MINNTTYEVIVLGGGVAGLACADEILRNSHKSVLVIEKNAYLGGLAVTIKYKKFRFDLSPHRWFTKNIELNTWFINLIGEDIIWIKRKTPMFQFGIFFDYPLDIKDVLMKLNVIRLIVMVMSYLFQKITNFFLKEEVKSMKDAYIARFGWGLYYWFNKEYNEKLWGDNGCENMTADFVNQRVKNLSLFEVIKNSFGIQNKSVISLISRFQYPKMGIGQISDKLKKRILKNSGKISLNELVIKISKTKNGYTIETPKNIYFCHQIVSSIPLDNLALLIFRNNKNITHITKNLTYIHQRVVVLFSKKDKLTNYTWVYVHPSEISMFRFLETGNWSKMMSPSRKTSLVFEYPYQDGDDIEKKSNTELIKITKNDFIKYFSHGKIEIEDLYEGKVYNVKNAYPKYNLNYKESVRSIKLKLKEEHPNIQYIGRNGMFHYNNLDHSVYTGILAAQNIIRGVKLFDLDLVNNEAEYQEEINSSK